MNRSADAALWWNIPGCIAAYQAIRAPSQQAASRNMARNRNGIYTLTTSAAPSWSAATGWSFPGLTTLHLSTGIQWANTWTVIVRCYCEGRGISGYGRAIGGAVDTLAIAPDTGDGLLIKNGTTNFTALAAATVATVIAIAGGDAYRDGSDIGNITVGAISDGTAYIGNRASLNREFRGTIQAVAFYTRTLSPYEIWHVSRQMLFCDKNPDWSVWTVSFEQRPRWLAWPLPSSYTESLTLARAHAIAASGMASASGASPLARTHAIVGAGQASAAGAATLGIRRATSDAGIASAAGAVGLAATRGASDAGTATASGAATLSATRGASASGTAAASGSMALGAQRGVVSGAIRTAAGAVALGIRRALVALGLSTTFTPTPAWRTYTPPAESRILTLEAEDRTYTPPLEDRTYTVEADD